MLTSIPKIRLENADDDKIEQRKLRTEYLPIYH